ncbi:YebC/PmpR family DNA-binding transcriptional regulator [Acholeplasma sp. OttesenSCG-928-E16]|nr:YebC/PmpR family DNA-binding transcriptional regulator [Acholeplasma sp. OttesenSCG-928-E16]
MGRAFEVRKVAMAKTAAAKSKVYAKYGREIFVAAKSGTPDPETNQNLKRIIEKAKRDQVSADVIKRAIDKAKGGSDETYTSVRYEGFGPGNTLFIVECLSDNVNRTVAEVRNCFTKTGGKLGVAGSVLHQFEHKSIFSTNELTEEEVLEALIENDINADIEDEDGMVLVYGDTSDYYKIKTALLEKKEDINFEVDEITFIPIMVSVLENDEDIQKFERLVNMLDELDDVQEVYNNAKY